MSIFETKLTTKIRQYINSKEDYCFKFKGDAYTEIGTPDLLCLLKGRFVAIEVKYGKNKPTPIQYKQIELINARKAIAVWVNETNWKEIIDEIYEKFSKGGDT